MTEANKLKDVVDEYRKTRQEMHERISKAIEEDRRARQEQKERPYPTA